MSMFTLVAFLNLTVGCTVNKSFTLEEIEKKTGRKIMTVVLPTVIEGVQLPNGEEIIFEITFMLFNIGGILLCNGIRT